MWSFRRQAFWICNKALEQDIIAIEVNERGTTHSCYLCRSKMIELEGGMLRCSDCGLEIDRDEHGAINIAFRALNQGAFQGMGVAVNPPKLRMSEPEKLVNAEARTFSAGQFT